MSTTLEPIFYLVSFLLLAGVLIFLYLQAKKQMQENLGQQSEFLSKATEIALLQATKAQESAEEQAADNQSRFERVTALLTSELQRQQELSQKSQDLTLTRALSGSSETMKQVMSLLTSATTMLGTKDPIAYNQVSSGQSFSQDDSSTPYTHVDQAAEAAAEEAAKQAALLEQAMVELAGLPEEIANGSTGQPQPYSFQS